MNSKIKTFEKNSIWSCYTMDMLYHSCRAVMGKLTRHATLEKSLRIGYLSVSVLLTVSGSMMCIAKGC